MVWWCIQLTRLTLVCEVIRYHLVQARQISQTRFFGLARITFLYLFLFHSLLCLTSFLSQNKNFRVKSLKQFLCFPVCFYKLPEMFTYISVYQIVLQVSAFSGGCGSSVDGKGSSKSVSEDSLSTRPRTQGQTPAWAHKGMRKIRS